MSFQPPSVPLAATSADCIIAVLGVTGAGKSTFINTVCGGNFCEARGGAASCTKEVQYAKAFIDGRNVVLIDTPGFNDTNFSDERPLIEMAEWLRGTSDAGILLNGIIILQPITEERVYGTENLLIGLLKNIIGPTFLNVFLGFTKYDTIDRDLSDARFTERLKGAYWGQLCEKAALLNNSNARQAHGCVRLFLSKPPQKLQMQEELDNVDGYVARTSAGLFLMNHLREVCDNLETGGSNRSANPPLAYVAPDLSTFEQRASARPDQFLGSGSQAAWATETSNQQPPPWNPGPSVTSSKSRSQKGMGRRSHEPLANHLAPGSEFPPHSHSIRSGTVDSSSPLNRTAMNAGRPPTNVPRDGHIYRLPFYGNLNLSEDVYKHDGSDSYDEYLSPITEKKRKKTTAKDHRQPRASRAKSEPAASQEEYIEPEDPFRQMRMRKARAMRLRMENLERAQIKVPEDCTAGSSMTASADANDTQKRNLGQTIIEAGRKIFEHGPAWLNALSAATTAVVGIWEAGFCRTM